MASRVMIFVFLELATTLGHLTSHDMADAERRGRATVESCSRTGPVGDGFGYWDRCTVTVTWDGGGTGQRALVTRGSFFVRSEVGRTFAVGDAGTYRGTRQLARPERPHRLWVQLLAGFRAVVAAIFGWVIMVAVKDLFRERAVRRRPGTPPAGG